MTAADARPEPQAGQADIELGNVPSSSALYRSEKAVVQPQASAADVQRDAAT